MALDTSLTAFWNMNEPSPFLPCEDSVGSNHLVAYAEPEVIQGIIEQGRSFTKTSEHYLSAADSADLSVGS